MRHRLTVLCLIAAGLVTAGCAATSFTSTWKSPEAKPALERLQGEKIAAFVMTKNDSSRRTAEDWLAARLSTQGAQGVASYTILGGVDVNDEAAVKAALEKAGISGVVAMRPVAKENRMVSTASSYYVMPYYRPFWGGYYRYGTAGAWGPTEVHTDTIVSVETLVYSLKDNTLIWAGQSKTTNPGKIDAFVKEVAEACAKQMKKDGLF